jgi:hypothetical protein
MRRFAFLLMAIGSLRAAHASAQVASKTKKPVAAGRVEGDLYLVMKSGDTKRGAGRTVYLLRDTKDLRSGLALACAAHDSVERRQRDSVAAVRQNLKDSAEAAYRTYLAGITNSEKGGKWNRLSGREMATFTEQSELTASLATATRAIIDAMIVRSAIDTTGSGMNAHYSFAISKPGKYVLFSDWQIGDNAYRWWLPIEITSGKSIRRDLDNAAEASDKLYCGSK